MSASPASLAPRKSCPVCSQKLALTEFGIVRSRSDGHNLYCRSCIRKKVTDSRRALKEYREVRKRYVNQPLLDCSSSYRPPRLVNELSLAERVRAAISRGARTQKEIRKAAELGDDQVGEGLAHLMLWTREVKSRMIGNTRHYFINNDKSIMPLREEASMPARMPDLPALSAKQASPPAKRKVS